MLDQIYRAIAVIYWVTIFTILLPVQALAGTHNLPDSVSQGKILVIGKVSTNPKKHHGYLKPIADYMATKLQDLGYQKSTVLMARDNLEMATYLKEGRVDWVTETPFTAMILKREAGAELLLRKWKKQVPEYHTVFFARKDSGIKSLDDLKGKTITFQDPGSTSAYYIPAYLLLQQGIKLVKLSSHSEKVVGMQTGYTFAGEEINISTWVHKGIVDAGTFSNLDWAKGDNNPEQFREDFLIFHRSSNYPRAVELVRKDLPIEVKQRIKEVLLEIHKDPQAFEALQAYQLTKKFDHLTPEILKILDDSESIIDVVDNALD